MLSTENVKSRWRCGIPDINDDSSILTCSSILVENDHSLNRVNFNVHVFAHVVETYDEGYRGRLIDFSICDCHCACLFGDESVNSVKIEFKPLLVV